MVEIANMSLLLNVLFVYSTTKYGLFYSSVIVLKISRVFFFFFFFFFVVVAITAVRDSPVPDIYGPLKTRMAHRVKYF